MLEGYIKLNGQKLPSTLLEHPSLEHPSLDTGLAYILDLYRKPEAMAKIMVKSYQLELEEYNSYHTLLWWKPLK